MSVQVGLWSVCNGWLLVDGARWYWVWVGGLLVVMGWGGRGWVLCPKTQDPALRRVL